MSASPNRLCVIILAGGKSSRMGVNKALLRQPAGGPTLIERVVKRIRLAEPAELYIVTRDAETYKFLGLPIIEDNPQAIGALGGIISGLRSSKCPLNLVVACDMPNIDPDFVMYLASVPGYHDAVVPRWTDERGQVRIEPLHALYSRQALPSLLDCAASGVYALHECLLGLDVRYVDEHEFAHLPGATNSFSNVNSRSDWQRFADEQPSDAQG